MKHNARLTKIEHRRTVGSGRLLMGYSEDGLGGPLWCNGIITEPLPGDRIIRICYKAADDAPNVKRLTWGDEPTE